MTDTVQKAKAEMERWVKAYAASAAKRGELDQATIEMWQGAQAAHVSYALALIRKANEADNG